MRSGIGVLLAWIVLCGVANAACTNTDGVNTYCEGGAGAAGTSQDGDDVVALSPIAGTVSSDTQYHMRPGMGGTGGTGDAGDGGDTTGNVVIDVDLAIPGGVFSYSSRGGVGGTSTGAGKGGDGGDSQPSIVANLTGQAGSVLVGSSGGDGGGSNTGLRGNGADSGPVTVTADGNFGTITVVTNGGALQGQNATGGTAGEAGDATLDFSGTAGSLYVQSAGGFGLGNGQAGQGGDVRIAVRGEVANDVLAHNAGGLPGSVLVILDDGAKVGGTIRNYNNTHGQLEFAMHVATQAELDAATASIAAVGGNTNGTVVVAGNSFAFSGFSSLRNLISVLQAQNPGGGPIVVEVAGGPTITISSSGEPGSTFQAVPSRIKAAVRSHCRGRVTSVLQDDGRIQLNFAPRDERPFILGWYAGAEFELAAPGWVIEEKPVAGGLKVKVSDPGGKLIATCTIAVA